ncbi:methyl-accepting chemotaxis protein [Paenibacillus roseipurpureus]|uniref:HAMP domain-containing methyl-accepting chemotaxis protein n=1 Tax=Paenibacillus roseopurpureus TaxID=2918901 RepID=A0AA96LPH8_9BACL|nr:HAMP domain-containing methyl-accepting chemotaxis protein [Paenibacillus sp. MBLB1832]WNR43438.1 HAMP domain-containing methyl-accepting chemotaxis protein [Paenibacillus sp. MBLB1832]
MQLSVRTKLVTVFAIILLLVGGISWTDLSRMGALKQTNVQLAGNWMNGIQTIEDIHYNSEHMLALYFQKKLEPDVKKHEPFDTGLTASITQIDNLLAKYKDTVANDEDELKLQELNKNWDAFKAAFLTNKQLTSDPSKAKEAIESTQIMTDAFKKMQPSIAELVAFNQKGGLLAVEDSEQVYQTSIRTSVMVLSVLILFMLATCYFLVMNISVPVRKASQAMNRIANGDLTVERIVVKNKDEIGRMIGAVNQMVNHLRDSVEQMQIASTSVAASSQQLFSSSEQNTSASQHVAVSVQDFASGADTQAQSSVECGRAMEEMAAGISRIAETTADVSELSMTATQLAEHGTQAMGRVVHKMQQVSTSVDEANEVIHELEHHSQNIGQITTLIGHIASQTNLLALNAAIEAARAGESGRGFAVVAGEVRKLASQTDDSVREISDLIANMQRDSARAVDVMNAGRKQVQEGMNEVGVAEQAFGQIVQASQEVASKIQETAAAAEQMAASSEEVAATVAQVGFVAQQTSGTVQSVAAVTEEQLASAEEITASAKNLAVIATDLNQVVNSFRLN